MYLRANKVGRPFKLIQSIGTWWSIQNGFFSSKKLGSKFKITSIWTQTLLFDKLFIDTKSKQWNYETNKSYWFYAFCISSFTSLTVVFNYNNYFLLADFYEFKKLANLGLSLFIFVLYKQHFIEKMEASAGFQLGSSV